MESFGEEDRTFIEELGYLSQKIRTSYEHFHLRRGLPGDHGASQRAMPILIQKSPGS